MKLSNLTLAILVGIGVTACGGGGDDHDQTTPTPTPPTTPTPTPTPTKPDSKPEDPARKEPSMEVEKNLANDVKAAKALYAASSIRDKALGYTNSKDARGIIYAAGTTKVADILREGSIINYSEKGWAHLNPALTYVKTDRGYYRVQPVSAPGVATDWDASDIKGYQVVARYDAKNPVFPDTTISEKLYSRNELLYIPNANRATGRSKTSGFGSGDPYVTKAGKDVPADTRVGPVWIALNGLDHGAQYGKTSFWSKKGYTEIINNNVDDEVIKDPTDSGNPGGNLGNAYNVGQGKNVNVKSFKIFDKDYSVSDIKSGTQYDLSKVKVDKSDVKPYPLEIKYEITDSKFTNSNLDDETVSETTTFGETRIYNLPYSYALFTVNASGKAYNSLEFSDGALGAPGTFGHAQVHGSPTTALPYNGRADYTGKSFGENARGDVHLRADFGQHRAGIQGSINNRTTWDKNTKLQDLTLERITLSTPTTAHVATIDMGGGALAADVIQAGKNYGTWEVGLFGPNAEEAAGAIFVGGNTSEVFSTQRGPIIKDSLGSPGK